MRDVTTAHREALARLQAYLDGELSDRDRAAVSDHLEACAECRTALEELRELQALLMADPQPELRTSAWPRIADRLESSKPWWDPVVGFATAGAAIAGLVIGLMLGTGTTSNVSANDDLWSAVGATIATDRGLALAEFPTTQDEGR